MLFEINLWLTWLLFLLSKYSVNGGLFGNEMKLYQNDFEDATYIIDKPGKYILMEDVTLDFNGDYDNPNSLNAWWPDNEMSDNNSNNNNNNIGYFAGMLIKTDNVLIDLNGFEMKMSKAFYFQQKYFSVIAIQKSNIDLTFLNLNDNNGNNENELTDIATNNGIEIKNGKIGLTSGYGIYGKYLSNIVFSDLKITNFDVSAISLNHFSNIIFSQIDIGYSSHLSFINNKYYQSRMLLHYYYNNMNNENNNDNNNNMRLKSLINELEKQMNFAFNYALNGIIPRHCIDSISDCYDNRGMNSWQSAKKLFINDNGIPFDSSICGIQLTNSLSNNNNNKNNMDDVTIENVFIHDILHSTIDYEMINNNNNNNNINYFFAGFDKMDFENNGNVLTDILHLLLYNDEMPDNNNNNNNNNNKVVCNNNYFMNDNYGSIGIRIENVSKMRINHLYISNIHEMGSMGDNPCQLSNVNNYLGTSANAMYLKNIENGDFNHIEINGIYSNYGLSFGMSIYPLYGSYPSYAAYPSYKSKIYFNELISISNIFAAVSLPSRKEENNGNIGKACGIETFDLSSIMFKGNNNLNMKCISGESGCHWINDYYNMFGQTFIDCDNNKITQSSIVDINNNVVSVASVANVGNVDSVPNVPSSNNNNNIKKDKNEKSNNNNNNNNRNQFGTFWAKYKLIILPIMIATVMITGVIFCTYCCYCRRNVTNNNNNNNSNSKNDENLIDKRKEIIKMKHNAMSKNGSITYDMDYDSMGIFNVEKFFPFNKNSNKRYKIAVTNENLIKDNNCKNEKNDQNDENEKKGSIIVKNKIEMKNGTIVNKKKEKLSFFKKMNNLVLNENEMKKNNGNKINKMKSNKNGNNKHFSETTDDFEKKKCLNRQSTKIENIKLPQIIDKDGNFSFGFGNRKENKLWRQYNKERMNNNNQNNNNNRLNDIAILKSNSTNVDLYKKAMRYKLLKSKNLENKVESYKKIYQIRNNKENSGFSKGFVDILVPKQANYVSNLVNKRAIFSDSSDDENIISKARKTNPNKTNKNNNDDSSEYESYTSSSSSSYESDSSSYESDSSDSSDSSDAGDSSNSSIVGQV